MADVVKWGGVTRLHGDPNESLKDAQQVALETVVVIGRTTDRGLYFCSSTPDGGDVLWLMEDAKRALLSGELE